MDSNIKKPFVVGVTGGIGSGKSVVTSFFASLDITIIDADIAARSAVKQGQSALNEITARYGEEIILKEGFLDRRKLRDIIFNNFIEKKWIEKLLHPKVFQLIQQQLAISQSSYTILVSPILIETSQHQLVDRILVIDVPELTQIERATTRDDMTIEQTRRIIVSQASRESRLALADDVIDNTVTLGELYEELEKLHKKYILLSNSHR